MTRSSTPFLATPFKEPDMLINIEDITLEEYEILIRGGNSPGLGRLSIDTMTMNEYNEMIRKTGSDLNQLPFSIEDRQRPPEFYTDEEEFTDEDEEREWKELEIWLTNTINNVQSKETINEASSPTISLPESTPNHTHESNKFVNDIFNESDEFEQEIIEETWFDAPIFDDDGDIDWETNQEEPIIFSLQALDSTTELKEVEDLLKDSETNLFEETNRNANETNKPQYSFIALEKNVTHKFLFATFQDVCITHFNPRREYVILRKTRKWKDAWVQLCKILVQSNKALFLNDYILTVKREDGQVNGHRIKKYSENETERESEVNVHLYQPK